MARVQVLYWQDIPSVLKAFDDDGGAASSRELPPSFQEAIDRRAMELGLAASDAYLEQWHWGEVEERPGSALEALDALERELLESGS